MILDDGGDLTSLVHEKYPQYLAGELTLRNRQVILVPIQWIRYSRLVRGNHDGCPPPIQGVPRRTIESSGYKCQRFRHQVQV